MSIVYQKPPNNYQNYVGTQNYVDHQTGSISVTGPNATANFHLLNAPPTLVQDGQSLFFHARGNIIGTAATKNFRIVVPNVSTITIAGFAAGDIGDYVSYFTITRGLFEGGALCQLAGVTSLGNTASVAAVTRVVRLNLVGFVFSATNAFQLQWGITGADTVQMDYSSLSVL